MVRKRWQGVLLRFATREKKGRNSPNRKRLRFWVRFRLDGRRRPWLPVGDIRAEAAVSYASANYNKFTGSEIRKDSFDTLPSLTILSFMANGWYEIDTGTMFSPFIGLGLGGFHGTISTGKLKAATDSNEQTGWGLQFRAEQASPWRSPMACRYNSGIGYL